MASAQEALVVAAALHVANSLSLPLGLPSGTALELPSRQVSMAAEDPLAAVVHTSDLHLSDVSAVTSAVTSAAFSQVSGFSAWDSQQIRFES